MSTLREIALLKQLDAFKHPNIVKYVSLQQNSYENNNYSIAFIKGY